MVEQSFARKGKCGSQYQDLSYYLSCEFNPKGHNITKSIIIVFVISNIKIIFILLAEVIAFYVRFVIVDF